MNILCLHPYLSMRAIKEMRALKALNHNVTLAYEGLGCSVEKGFGKFWDEIIEIPGYRYKGEYFLRRLIPKSYKRILNSIIDGHKFDIIHAFSMPDTLAVAAIRYSGLPVIFDQRDVSSGVGPFLLEDLKHPFLNRLQEKFYRRIVIKFEREANQASHGRIFSSTEMQTYVSRQYDVDMENTIVLPNYETGSNLPRKKKDKLSKKKGGIHLVYEGNISYDYYSRSMVFFNELADHSIHLHIYPVGDLKIIKKVENGIKNNHYIKIHSPLPPQKLIEEMQQYDFGLLPFPPDLRCLNIKLVLANKLFEYLLAGLPIASRNNAAMASFILNNNVGFVYNTTKELVAKVREGGEKFIIDPSKFVMEKHIGVVLNLYQKTIEIFRN